MNFFLSSLMGKGNKSKNDKFDLFKLKCIFTANETTNKINGQPTEWKKISANDITEKGLISKIYKQLNQLNIKN